MGRTLSRRQFSELDTVKVKISGYISTPIVLVYASLRSGQNRGLPDLVSPAFAGPRTIGVSIYRRILNL